MLSRLQEPLYCSGVLVSTVHRRPCSLLRVLSSYPSMPSLSLHQGKCSTILPSLHANIVQKWNGQYFEPTTLQAVGLVFQLGHPPGQCCPAPALAPRSFLVIDTNGFHPVTVQYCQCSGEAQTGIRIQQLLRNKLYPATLDDPSMCCTFDTLNTFHLLTLQSKITAYDFYLTLQKLTDCVGLSKRYVSAALELCCAPG